MNEVELCLMVVSIFLTLPCNIANIAIILRAERLHIGPSYVLFNLYIADMLVVSLNMIKFITKGWNQIDAGVESYIKYFAFIGNWTCYRPTYCCQIPISIPQDNDQAISPTLFGTSLDWIHYLCFFPLLFTDTQTRYLIEYCIHGPIRICFASTIILSAIWIKRERDKHTTIIRQRNIYFGLYHRGNFTIWKLIKTTVMDMFKLSIFTGSVLILSDIASLLHFFGSSNGVCFFLYIHVSLTFTYLVTNPFIYAISIRELKQQYMKMIKRIGRKERLFHL